jgi:hypothetical protein
MKKYLIILIILGAIILATAIFLIYSSQNHPPSLVQCKTILENNGTNKINVVFLTDNVDESRVEGYSNFLLNSEPFSSNKEKFDFFYAGNAGCKIFDSLLFCYSKDLIEKSSACKNDYTVVLSSKSVDVRSTTYMNVMSLNVNHPDSVILHEFGHAFANLADEYVPSIIPRGAENCGQTCSKFNDTEGCFQGCSQDSYYRSSENSVMRTLATNDYNKLNTIIIEKDLKRYG